MKSRKSLILILALLLSSTAAWSMSNQDKVSSSFNNLKRNAQESDDYQTEVLGLSFWANGQVFSPKYFTSTTMLTEHFPFRKNERFIEIGSGVGVASVLAAKSHLNRVVAIDINPEAVRLTKKNAALHRLSDRIDVREGNVFSALHLDERFDTIFWDLPYVFTESTEKANLSMLQRSVSDPGYVEIENFLEHAKAKMTPQGRIIVGFGSNGDFEKLSALCAKHRYRINEIYQGFHPYRDGITYQLLELKPMAPDLKNWA